MKSRSRTHRSYLAPSGTNDKRGVIRQINRGGTRRTPTSLTISPIRVHAPGQGVEGGERITFYVPMSRSARRPGYARRPAIVGVVVEWGGTGQSVAEPPELFQLKCPSRALRGGNTLKSE
jgi:hypothetical protein